MTEHPGSRPGPGQPGGGAMSERMQALLSRAAEDQLTEQRQVSAVLADLRGLVAGLSDQLRETASSSRLESLSGDLAALTSELRMSTSGLGERLDTLGRRVDEQGASTADIVRGGAEGNDALAVRVSALSGDVVDQGSALDRLTEAVTTLSAFPDAISSLQREVSGLHDRLAPLGEVRSSLADLDGPGPARWRRCVPTWPPSSRRSRGWRPPPTSRVRAIRSWPRWGSAWTGSSRLPNGRH